MKLIDNAFEANLDVLNEQIFRNNDLRIISRDKIGQNDSKITIIPIKGGDPSSFDKPLRKASNSTNPDIMKSGVFNSTMQFFKTKPLIAYPVAVVLLSGIGYSVIKSQQK
jgi:hypothetical protein